MGSNILNYRIFKSKLLKHSHGVSWDPVVTRINGVVGIGRVRERAGVLPRLLAGGRSLL